ncbi:hypothetical protein ODJ79_09385 [Actinoplanes sp. KI2]|uniref:hypothetical protein n=1 Tax=Actinoplanes sp. KI2 TaxID=2983315 RepID=UPI0021D5B9CA|nr:hypothetical protein [Actinoplanes sp. KI2]MCU7723926.1 hypothetical protein [Actinoplanes sp. KI2]
MAPVLAAAAATTVGLTTAQPAQAVAEWAHLTIRPQGGGNYSLTVSGHFNLPQAVPTSYSIKIIGEDTWFDDTPVCDAWPLTTDANGNYWYQYSCTGALLNEDWDGQDENYAKVTVFPSGARSHSVRSNTVNGYY